MKKIDQAFLRWMARGHEAEIPKRFLGAMWRCLDTGFIRIKRDTEVWLTRKGRKAVG